MGYSFLVLAWKAQGREKRKILAGRGGSIRRALVPQHRFISAVPVLVKLITCSGREGRGCYLYMCMAQRALSGRMNVVQAV